MGTSTGYTDESEPLHTIDELCTLLSVKKKTVYKWTTDRRTGIPFYKLGKHLRFRFSEVNLWMRKYRGSEGALEFNKIEPRN